MEPETILRFVFAASIVFIAAVGILLDICLLVLFCWVRIPPLIQDFQDFRRFSTKAFFLTFSQLFLADILLHAGQLSVLFPAIVLGDVSQELEEANAQVSVTDLLWQLLLPRDALPEHSRLPRSRLFRLPHRHQPSPRLSYSSPQQDGLRAAGCLLGSSLNLASRDPLRSTSKFRRLL